MFTAVSYNIKCASLTDFDISFAANDIKAVGADIAGLQEIDRMTERNGYIDVMPAASSLSGMDYFGFFGAMPYRGGEYGIGFLSKYKPMNQSFHALPSMPGLEPRIFCSVQLNIQNKNICFINTHLSYENEKIQRLQLKALGEYLSALNMPFVVTGDFNTDNFVLFDDLGIPVSLLNNNDRYYPSFYPSNTAIDNIIISKSLKFIKTGMYTAACNSDHYMIYAVIDFI